MIVYYIFLIILLIYFVRLFYKKRSEYKFVKKTKAQKEFDEFLLQQYKEILRDQTAWKK